MTYTTQKQVRAAFWANHPGMAQAAREAGTLTKGQNAQGTDIRVAFVEYVDSLARNGDISETLAQRVTL
jgi:hypothetical protein